MDLREYRMRGGTYWSLQVDAGSAAFQCTQLLCIFPGAVSSGWPCSPYAIISKLLVSGMHTIIDNSKTFSASFKAYCLCLMNQ